jgi:hypothetical protein
MNPSVRGFLIIGAIALAIVLLSLEQAVMSLHLIARVAFFLAIAFVLFLLWRDRRAAIAEWSRRGRLAFYGAGALLLANLGAFFWPGRRTAGLDAVVVVLVLAICVFSMVRVWRDERSYGF